MKKVKNILFRVDLSGYGVVNYDGPEQKFILRHCPTAQWSTTDNVKYAKKVFFHDENGNLDYKLKISAGALTKAIFGGEIPFQSPNVVHADNILYSYIGSPAALLRGYMFTPKSGTLNRKHAANITDAIQVCNAKSYLEMFSKSGEKTNTSLFSKETIGDIKYKATGNLDIMELQFLSTSSVFDRKAMDPDCFNLFKIFLSSRLKNFKSNLSEYTIKNSVCEIPEQGVLFSSENVNQMVNEYFLNLLSMRIDMKGAYVKIDKVEYKLVYDVLEDIMESEDGWQTLTKDGLKKFDIEIFYEEVSKEKSEQYTLDIKAGKLKEEKLKEVAEKNKEENTKKAEAAKEKKTTKAKATAKA